jgi:hypothetical protein
MQGFILLILDINTEVRGCRDSSPHPRHQLRGQRMQRFILFILDINAEVKRMEGFILLILLKTSTQRSR